MPVLRPKKIRPKARKPTGPLNVTMALSIREAVYLDALVAGGLHGVSRQEVVRTFMRRGLQDAYRDGFIGPRT